MELARKKLGLLLSTGPDHPNLDTALGLSTAALDRGAGLIPLAPSHTSHTPRVRVRDQVVSWKMSHRC